MDYHSPSGRPEVSITEDICEEHDSAGDIAFAFFRAHFFMLHGSQVEKGRRYLFSGFL